MRARRSAVAAAAMAALVASLLAGCGGEPAPDTAEPPASPMDVLDGVPKVTVDPAGTSATLVATTLEKASCRVFYGRSPAAEEGSATDADGMTDGPHTTHRAVMTGLVPNSTYYYRFEGTDESGKAFAGPGGQFKTGAPAKPAGENLALNAKIEAVSSEFGSGFEAKNALDGDPATEWSTAGDGDRGSITLDLGRVATLTGIAFKTRSMSDGTSITKEIEVIVDGKRYGPFALGEGGATIHLKAKGRIVRIKLVETTGGNVGAQDIAVYGK